MTEETMQPEMSMLDKLEADAKNELKQEHLESVKEELKERLLEIQEAKKLVKKLENSYTEFKARIAEEENF